MERISFKVKEVKKEPSETYNFSQAERDEYISEISEQIVSDVRSNELNEIESYERASKFVTTR